MYDCEPEREILYPTSSRLCKHSIYTHVFDANEIDKNALTNQKIREI